MDDRDRQRRAGRMIPISFRLLGASLVVGAVAVTIAYFSLERIHALNELRTQTVSSLADRATLAALIKEDLAAILRAERDMLHAKSDEDFQRSATGIDRQLAAMDDRIARLIPLLNEEDRERLATFSKKWHDWRENHEQVRNFARLQSDQVARNVALGPGGEAYGRLTNALSRLIDQCEQALEDASAAADSAAMAESSRKLLAVERLQQAMNEARREELNLLLASTEDEIETRERSFDPLARAVREQMQRLHELVDDGEAQTLAEAQKGIDDYWLQNIKVRQAVGQKGRFLTELFAFDVGGPLAVASEEALRSLNAGHESDMQAHREQSNANYASARTTLIGFTIAGVLASTLAALLTGHGIARRLNRLTGYARRIHETGDLSLSVPHLAGDEVGQLATAFEQMRSSLHEKTQELAATNEALTQKSREMEQFVYTVSHDLKSPLVSLKGLLMLMREDIEAGDRPAVSTSLQGLEGAVNQLGKIIDDLLTLSRIGSKPLDLAEIDPREVVLELADELAPRFTETGAELEVRELPHVIADRVDFVRALENLLANALKYGCRSSDPHIAVGGKVVGNEVRFFVQDNGPGIEPEYHEKIFGLFQRLDTDTEGTGLGLASVSKVMRLHGGRTWVESALGQGATFWIAFPRMGLRQTEAGVDEARPVRS